MACTSEVDLQLFNDCSNQWTTIGTARQSKCAPPLRSSTAGASCEHHSGDPTHAFRTTTYGTLVGSGGSASSGSAHSPVLYLACV
ncbi:hypothetical protein [Streptomyces sp. NPDC007856]|uniref:hypothetical protein n=1 Tax=Streptomyces sp. NPDC007856 TaxID=3364781 RepID=UPI0036B93B87